MDTSSTDSEGQETTEEHLDTSGNSSGRNVEDGAHPKWNELRVMIARHGDCNKGLYDHKDDFITHVMEKGDHIGRIDIESKCGCIWNKHEIEDGRTK